MLIALTMWLFGNFWWMLGEMTSPYGDDYVNSPQAIYMFEGALTWIMLYHLVWRPLGIIKPNLKLNEECAAAGLVPRFSYFQTWKQYEHAHFLFWCGKDLSWDYTFPPTWIFFVIPTLFIAGDFIYCTWKCKVRDCLLTLSANITRVYVYCRI